MFLHTYFQWSPGALRLMKKFSNLELKPQYKPAGKAAPKADKTMRAKKRSSEGVPDIKQSSQIKIQSCPEHIFSPTRQQHQIRNAPSAIKKEQSTQSEEETGASAMAKETALPTQGKQVNKVNSSYTDNASGQQGDMQQQDDSQLQSERLPSLNPKRPTFLKRLKSKSKKTKPDVQRLEPADENRLNDGFGLNFQQSKESNKKKSTSFKKVSEQGASNSGTQIADNQTKKVSQVQPTPAMETGEASGSHTYLRQEKNGGVKKERASFWKKLLNDNEKTMRKSKLTPAKDRSEAAGDASSSSLPEQTLQSKS